MDSVFPEHHVISCVFPSWKLFAWDMSLVMHTAELREPILNQLYNLKKDQNQCSTSRDCVSFIYPLSTSSILEPLASGRDEEWDTRPHFFLTPHSHTFFMFELVVISPNWFQLKSHDVMQCIQVLSHPWATKGLTLSLQRVKSVVILFLFKVFFTERTWTLTLGHCS